jgi:drug/metabolite transporter (DMT)-like permease
MSRPSASTIGWSATLLSTLCFSIAAPIGTALINLGLDPTTILVLRFWLALALLFLTLRLSAPDKLRLPRRALLGVAVAGPSIGVGVLLYFWSLTRLHTSIAAMLIALEPLITLLMLALRGERFTYRILIRLGLGLVGVYFLVGLQGSADWVGVLMVLGTAVLSSFHTVSLQWFLGDQDGRAVTTYIVLFMALTISAYWLIQRPPLTPVPWQGWLGAAALAVFSTYGARLLLFAGVKRLGGGQVALLAPVETMFTVIFSVIFLGDRLSAAQAVGGVFILASAVLAVERLRRARVPSPDETAEVIAQA